MPNGNNNNDGWDSFNWQTWGEEASAHGDDRRSRLNGAGGGAARDADGDPAEFGGNGNGWREGEGDLDADATQSAPGSGHWMRHGGIVSWEAEDEESSDAPVSPRKEAQTVWADDDLDIPPGAPDSLRVRATHAWLARQRLLEEQALGILLLERRRLSEGSAESDEADTARHGHQEPEAAPLDLALAEHQAAIEAYDAMIETLDGIAAHTGPSAVLVEFYLWLTEDLARLAAAPEAPEDFAERLLLVPVESEEAIIDTPAAQPTPRSSAEWQGRAEATVQARKRVEQVSALDPEE